MAKRNIGINIFRHVPEAKLPKTGFNMSHEVKFSGDFGKAYPVLFQEVLPGDTWSVACNHFSRLAPMIAPVMHEYDVRFHWFFVPLRLLWDDFEDWMTGGRLGTWREDNPDAFPTIDYLGIFNSLFSRLDYLNTAPFADTLRGTIWDFLGLNSNGDGLSDEYQIDMGQVENRRFSILPVRAYWLIFNYFFRDQNVMDEIEIPTKSGAVFPEESSLYKNVLTQSYDTTYHDYDGLFRVAFDKDYFTSSTLTPQRGPQVFVPIGGVAPVIGTHNNGMVISGSRTGDEKSVSIRTDGLAQPSGPIGLNAEEITYSSTSDPGIGVLTSAADGFPTTITGYHSNPSITGTADLSSATGAAVDDVRESFALQRFFERLNVVGSRFSEFLRGIWGSNAGDARLQMPEYLGTWENPFMINNVSQTSATQSGSPQGGYAGNGMSSQTNQTIRKYFPEYGYLVCLYTAMPRNGYQQGLSKLLTRTDWIDFANPYFEHIGEQPIMTSELYYDPRKSEAEDTVFGYQSQYCSYKFIQSHSHGDFKQSLNFWHSNRIFSSEPTLSDSFIHFDPDETTNRAFQLTNEPKFYTLINFYITAERQLSPFSTPRMM